MKKDRFAESVKALYDKELQLLRDVVTRWSSTLLMIERVLDLKKVRISLKYLIFNSDITQAVIEITSDENELNLEKYELTDDEWLLLEDYQEILQVPSSLHYPQSNAHI
jgi:hypothetical protein